MSGVNHPTPEDDTPEDLKSARSRRRSRYSRPRSYISWFGVILGLALGIGGGLYFAWNIAPAEEVDTAPWQLEDRALEEYVVAVMLQHAHDGNLGETIERLIELRLPGENPSQAVADIACELARSGYVDSNSGLHAIRVMMAFYQSQQRSGCADNLIPMVGTQAPEVITMDVPTRTLPPPASKTPTPPGATVEASPTPSILVAPTAEASRSFSLIPVNTFCDADFSGIIEVRVQDASGDPLPGMPVRVRWTGGESMFLTGLKPERGLDYADFEMEAGVEYVIDMPGLSNPSANPLAATTCITETGTNAITSYRIVFRSTG